MRLRARVDRNHGEIAQALRKVGCSVESLARLGGGCPDLLVARAARMWLMEIKDAGQSPNAGQAEWATRWRAPVCCAHSVAEALAAVGAGPHTCAWCGHDHPASNCNSEAAVKARGHTIKMGDQAGDYRSASYTSLKRGRRLGPIANKRRRIQERSPE